MRHIVIASAAKQSRKGALILDCFATLAMTATQVFAETWHAASLHATPQNHRRCAAITQLYNYRITTV